MLQSESNKLKNFTVNNIHTITLDAVTKIEKELDPRDLVSLVFLLYDAHSHNVARECLIIYQRVCGDLNVTMNPLLNWAKHSQNLPSWRYQFLEALAICQLYNVIRKLGFDVEAIKYNFMPNYLHVERYVNPLKKVLYKLCEHMTSRNLQRLQNTLKTHNIKNTETKYAEVILLELMCWKFIIVEHENLEYKFEIDKLANIIENFPDIQVKHFAKTLRQIQNKYKTATNEPVAASTFLSSSEAADESNNDKVTAHAFEFVEKLIEDINMDEFCAKNLKTDTKKSYEGMYPIKNPERIGVCHVINQEDFELPDKQIEHGFIASKNLEKRVGSYVDRAVLEKTMKSLNFEVICEKNLNHKMMIEHIKSIVQYRVHPDHSIYMLCILSHGVQGHVFAADSVAVNIEYIKNLLDKGFEKRQLEIPKVLILQACRVNDEQEYSLVSDAPSVYRLPKVHFLVCWATAPELEAFRHETKGSIFIQIFCYLIKLQARHEDLLQIFTNAVNKVTKICSNLQKAQTPNAEFSLTKKLYLQLPE